MFWKELTGQGYGDKSQLMRFQKKLKILLGLELLPFCLNPAKNLTEFCPCPQNLRETKFKSKELISIHEEISRQHTIKAMVWLFLTTCIQIDNDGNKNCLNTVKFTEKNCGSNFRVEVQNVQRTKTL